MEPGDTFDPRPPPLNLAAGACPRTPCHAEESAVVVSCPKLPRTRRETRRCMGRRRQGAGDIRLCFSSQIKMFSDRLCGRRCVRLQKCMQATDGLTLCALFKTNRNAFCRNYDGKKNSKSAFLQLEAFGFTCTARQKSWQKNHLIEGKKKYTSACILIS